LFSLITTGYNGSIKVLSMIQGYHFLEKKIYDFALTFPDKFAVKKSNKCTDFVDTDSMLVFFSINCIPALFYHGLKGEFNLEKYMA